MVESMREQRGNTVSVVLGSYNRRAFLKAAVESIRSNGITVPYEIIVVDGGSTDGALEWLAQQSDVITIIQHNRSCTDGQSARKRNWGYFMNLGFKCAEGRYVVMMSDDSLLIPGAVMNGIQHYESLQGQGRTVGAIAYYWRNWPEQKDYWVGLTLGQKMFVNHGMYVRSALERVGWIDQDRFQFYYADGDVCLKLWQHGYEVVDCPAAFVEHYTHANQKVRESNLMGERTDWGAYLNKWQGVFYHADNPEIGTWITKSYEDSHQTSRLFPVLRNQYGVLVTLLSALTRGASYFIKR